jgi:steroid delta-isomerase-like uncharacterized protein
MNNEKNIEVFNQWLEAHIAHDLDALLECVTEDINIKSAAGGKMPPATNKEEARMHWASIYESFPDMRMELVDMTVSGDDMVAEISHGGTMTGAMGDKQPTGESYRVTGAFRMKFEDGKIKSILSYWDTASMLMQLNLIPQPA